MAARDEIVAHASELLEIDRFPEFAPQGLQVVGAAEVTTIACGVSCSRELFERAVDLGAELVLVHHGLFWRNEPLVVDRRQRGRLEALFRADASLLAYHLALDAHPTLGNAAQLAGLLRLVQAKVPPTHAPSSPTDTRRLVIRLPGRTLFVPYRDIVWIEGADYCARVHVGRKSHLLRESLRSLADRLDPRQFVRIHRSAIVNVARVRELRTSDGTEGMAVLDDGTELRVGRGRRSVLEQMLERDPAG